MPKRRDRRDRIKTPTTINSPREFGLKPMGPQHGHLSDVPKPVPPTPATVIPNLSARQVYERLNDFETALHNLRGRVHLLEEAQKTSPKEKVDPLAAQIVELLKSVPLKMNTGSIASNLNATSTLVHARLKYLVGKDGIMSSKEDGRSTVYWYEEPKEDSSE